MPTHLIGTDAFQECDTVGITRPCTKHNYLVKNVERPAARPARGVLRRGERPARAGGDRHPEGRAVRDRHLCSAREQVQHKTYQPKVKGDLDKIKAAVELMANAKKPVFYTGGGVINSGPQASHLLRELARLTGFPVTSTLMGLGAFPAADPQWLGMLGMHGTYEANWTMHDCDVMIVHRRALRRPHHRAARRLLAGFAEDPRRYRSVVDQQERQGRYPDRRRLRACAGGHDPPVEGGRPAAEQAGAGRLVEADRQLARAQLPRLSAVERDHQAAIRDPAAL